MPFLKYLLFLILCGAYLDSAAQDQTAPNQISFVRQGVRRFIFNERQSIHLASLNPGTVIGMSAMHPVQHKLDAHAEVTIQNNRLSVQSGQDTETGIWFGGFNPFATYSIHLVSTLGTGEIGFEFTDAAYSEQFFLTAAFEDDRLIDVKQKVIRNSTVISDESIATSVVQDEPFPEKLILQMLGSGLVLYSQNEGLPVPIGQSDFNHLVDLRKLEYLNAFQSKLFLNITGGQVVVDEVTSVLGSGVGLADIRAITYENGDPLIDQGRLWYTMSIRGRALPHHIQGVFSMNPTLFDIQLEGIILFDRKDGLLRNEVASHIYYDRKQEIWRGLTTGFSAFADPEEKKQLLAIESKRDPRFGFSVMSAVPFGMVGDIEDPHIIYDPDAGKWRMLTCENQGGYKAILMESDHWDRDYRRIAGPVPHNSTGTSILKIGDQFFCLSGSSERKIFIYAYPGLEEVGSLQMDLPPWDDSSGTRVWPNIVHLPEGYPFRYVALMMDRFNFPGLEGPNWSYGALYLYHGND